MNKQTIILIVLLLLNLSLNAIANVDISGTVYVPKISGIRWLGETRGVIKTEELEKLLALLDLPPTVKEYNEYPTKTPDTQKPFKVVEELDWLETNSLTIRKNEKLKGIWEVELDVFNGKPIEKLKVLRMQQNISYYDLEINKRDSQPFAKKMDNFNIGSNNLLKKDKMLYTGNCIEREMEINSEARVISNAPEKVIITKKDIVRVESLTIPATPSDIHEVLSECPDNSCDELVSIPNFVNTYQYRIKFYDQGGVLRALTWEQRPALYSCYTTQYGVFKCPDAEKDDKAKPLKKYLSNNGVAIDFKVNKEGYYLIEIPKAKNLLPLIEKYKNPESHDYEVFPGLK